MPGKKKNKNLISFLIFFFKVLNYNFKRRRLQMIEEIFPGIKPLSGGIPAPGVCICGCLCTPSDPNKDDEKDDYDDEG